MEFDAVELDAPISEEQTADYWREKAECLEEWVCELLGKNQELRTVREVVSSSMKRVLKSFQKIIVAYDDSPAAREALRAGIELCKLAGTPLETITVIEPPPIYSGLVLAVAPDVARDLEADRRRNYQQIMDFAVAEGRRHCVEVTGHVLEAGEVDGIVSFLRSHGADLLVIGLRQHSSHVARLWSTISSLEQEAPCNVLAIRAFSGWTVERP